MLSDICELLVMILATIIYLLILFISSIAPLFRRACRSAFEFLAEAVCLMCCNLCCRDVDTEEVEAIVINDSFHNPEPRQHQD